MRKIIFSSLEIAEVFVWDPPYFKHVEMIKLGIRKNLLEVFG